MHEKRWRPVAVLATLALVFGLCPSAAFAILEVAGGEDEFEVVEDLAVDEGEELASLEVGEEAEIVASSVEEISSNIEGDEDSDDADEQADEAGIADEVSLVAQSAPYDISAGSYYVNNQRTLTETGQAVEVRISGYINGSDGGSLVQGTDFRIASYKASDGTVLPGAPSAAGSYTAVLESIEPNTGTAEVQFEIYAKNDLALAAVTLNGKDGDYFAYTGEAIDPGVQVVLGGVTLKEGIDYTVIYETEDADKTRTSTLVGKGTYRIEVVAVEGNGKYTGSWYSGDWAKGWLHVVDKYDFYGGSLTLADGPYAVYEWTGSAVKPNVVVKDATGATLVEGKDYVLQFRVSPDYSAPWVSAVSDEGTYDVRASGIGKYATKQSEDGTVQYALIDPDDVSPHFCIAKPNHDLANATITMKATFAYGEGKDETTRVSRTLEDALKPVVVLDGKTLVEGVDYRLFYGKNGFINSGTLGEHSLYVFGNGDSEVNPSDYYGVRALTYTVVDDAAPASDTRVDVDTGVTVKGDVIADKSTTADASWVKLTVSEPEGDALENATATAKAAAEAAGALAVEVFDVTLDVVDGDGEVTERLTSGFDITLTFPVDAKYNGHVATITQIHDGVALAPKTVTVTDGSASIQVNRLSQFVIAVEEEMATTPASESVSGSDADSDADAAVTTTRPAAASAMPATGDVLPLSVAMLIAAAAGLACIIARRFANR